MHCGIPCSNCGAEHPIGLLTDNELRLFGLHMLYRGPNRAERSKFSRSEWMLIIATEMLLRARRRRAE